MRRSANLAFVAHVVPLLLSHGANADDGWTSDFSLLEEYRLRIASHALPNSGPLGAPLQTNQASDQHLRLLGDRQISGMNDHFHAVVSGALWLDLDGPSAPGAASLFATQFDNAQPWLAVYALSAEWQAHKALDFVRVGRQASEHGLPLTFDGASLAVRALGRKLQLFGFGGKMKIHPWRRGAVNPSKSRLRRTPDSRFTTDAKKSSKSLG